MYIVQYNNFRLLKFNATCCRRPIFFVCTGACVALFFIGYYRSLFISCLQWYLTKLSKNAQKTLSRRISLASLAFEGVIVTWWLTETKKNPLATFLSGHSTTYVPVQHTEVLLNNQKCPHTKKTLFCLAGGGLIRLFLEIWYRNHKVILKIQLLIVQPKIDLYCARTYQQKGYNAFGQGRCR